MSNRYTALAAFIASRADAPFVWGENDCCIFAADAVRAQTGRDPLDWLRGKYRTEIDAKTIVGKGKGISAMTDNALGTALPFVTTARRGDVVLFESGHGPALGVCVGVNFAAVRPTGGLGYFSMRHAVKAWRIE